MPIFAFGRAAAASATASALAATLVALLYTAPGAAANAAEAPAALSQDERAALREQATGDMAKLVVHDAPKPRIEAPFLAADGRETSLAAFEGQVVLVNFWATWCPPCRAEMPSIDALAGEMAGADFAVVALSTDFGGLAKPRAFFEEIGVAHLSPYLDAERRLAREAAVMGLPVTVLLDRRGREVARLIGDAHWDTPEAKAVVRTLIEATAPGAS